MTPSNPSIEFRLAEISTLISDARLAIIENMAVDLGEIEGKIEDVCQFITNNPPLETQQTEQTLRRVLKDLDRLSEDLTRHHIHHTPKDTV